ncbi:MAG: hypothetical protein U9532_01615 ['Conium maculatum' witches'-broom phytoplasma]|nr:inmunodominant membrane protein [Phytoplasma sp.]MEC4558866.1 hypothetical protein ['Conium maculatum' witches'-broom phytoplasma]
MAAMDKQNKQSYLQTKNGKIVLGVVTAVVVLLAGVGAYLLMRNTPTKAIKNLETNLVATDKWKTVYTDAIDAANKLDNAEKKTKALKEVASKLKKYYSDMDYLTKAENKYTDDAKKTAYTNAQNAAKKVKAGLDEVDAVTTKDDAAVTALQNALAKVQQADCKTVVDEAKKVYEVK